MRACHRRLFSGAVALGTMIVAAAAMREPEAPRVHVFRITLGLKDAQPTDWDGKVTMTGGVVTNIAGWRFEDKDAVDGVAGWKCRTRPQIAFEQRYPVEPAAGKPRREAKLQPWPNGVTIAIQGDNPAVAVKLTQGELRFFAADVQLGEPRSFLNGAVRVDRLPATHVLRPAPLPREANAVQDDYPAYWIRYRTGKHYLAWVAYQNGKDRVLLVERDGPNAVWSPPLEVAGPGDHFRVALASLHDDTLWIVWSSQREHNWDLYARPYKDGKLGAEVRLTDAPGPDIWQRMTTDSHGRAWLVWQGFRDGQSDIFVRCVDTDGWHEPMKVSTSAANDWDPAIAADPREDRVWVGWDSYDSGSYNVQVRGITGGPPGTVGAILKPSPGPQFQAHIDLACDRAGRLWAAWDEAGPQWGKDTGYLYPNSPATRLYGSRRFDVRCLVAGQWKEPAGSLYEALPADMKEFNELPHLQPDSDGRMWLAFRHRTARRPREDGWAAQGRWDLFATAWLGDRWLPPIELPHSGGRNDMRTSSQRDREGGVYFAYASDNRGWLPPGMTPKNLDIAVSRFVDAPKPSEPKFAPPPGPPLPGRDPVHPREKEQVARIRTYKVEAGGKTYHIYRGDLHRHTDISTDGVGDGSLMDLHRYALDAAALDFVLVGDHNMGNDNEYCWWRTQKANDLYTVPGAFISLYGYERSVPYPNGHRNVIWTERGHRTLKLPQAAIPKQMAEDTDKLYAYLRQTGGICTLHTSATGQGTDWQHKIDGELEPFVEIFQGFHASMEAPGAPRIVDADSDIIHTSFKPDGYVSSALDKDYRLGFQSSSDHVSTHVSYACVLAEDFTRKGLVAAMRKRHSYAATDNIVLDVRMGQLGIMGDEVTTSQPRLDVVVLGTGPLARVDVVRNGEVVHRAALGGANEEARFQWTDPAPLKRAKATYYYVRVLQQDGQMAWASPIWVRTGN